MISKMLLPKPFTLLLVRAFFLLSSLRISLLQFLNPEQTFAKALALD